MRNRRVTTEHMLRALAEPQRLMILRLVRSRELRAGDIARHFKTTRSGISQHLRVLTDAGLLSQRRHGTSRLYRVRREGFAQLRDFLDTFWQDRLGNLKTAAEEIAKKRAL